ncbi:MAG: UDP-N-acetylglucosamine 2-epimerase [Roseburia sp.]
MEKEIDFKFSEKTVLVTFHPVTLEKMTAKEQFSNLLKVLDRHKELKIIFTKANADTDGRIINEMIDNFAGKNKNRCAAYTSLGQLRYLKVPSDSAVLWLVIRPAASLKCRRSESRQ